MSRKTSITSARSKATARGYELLDAEFRGYKHQHSFRCAANHVFLARAGNIFSGVAGCRDCWENRRGDHTRIDESHILEAAERFECQVVTDLSSFKNTKQRIDVVCGGGHAFDIEVGYLLGTKVKVLCAVCRDDNEPERIAKNGIARLEKLVEKHGGTVLSTWEEWPGDRGKCRIHCPMDAGHEFKASLSNIRKGNFCDIHKQRRKVWNLQMLQHAAAERGGACLSPEYHGTTEKHLWKCIAGHEWKAEAYRVVTEGTWCPHCPKKGELRCRAIFSQIFGVDFASQRPDWLREAADTPRLELDGYGLEYVIPSGPHMGLGIAFEYQGRQHYDATVFHSSQEAFEDQVRRDEIKRLRCKQNGVVLIEVPYFDKPYAPDDLLFPIVYDLLRAAEVPIPVHVAQTQAENYSSDYRSTFMTIVAEKGYTLFDEYAGEGVQLNMLCPIGHAIRPTPFNVRRSTTFICRRCKVGNLRRRVERQRADGTKQ